MTVQVAEHKAAAMEENDSRTGRNACAEGGVDTCLHRPAGAGDGDQRDICHLRRITLDRATGDIELLAQTIDRTFPVYSGKVRHLEFVHELAEGIIEAHDRLNGGKFRPCEDGNTPPR